MQSQGEIYGQPPPYSEVISTFSPVPEQTPVNMTAHISSSTAYQTNIPNVYQQTQDQPYYPGNDKPTAPLPPPPTGFTPNYGSIGNGPQIMPTEIIIIGGCPACRIGVLEDDYSCLGLACAILFFPLGILCCLAMKQKRCTHCGAEF